MTPDEYEYNLYLAHHGIKGQKWGQRRFQNEDGSLTPAGERRYAIDSAKQEYKAAKKADRQGRLAGAFDLGGAGAQGLKDYHNREMQREKAHLNAVDAKAKLASAKRGEKGELNAYAKELRRNGLAYSAADRMSGGKSARLYEHLSKTKGADFADRVQKKAQTQILTTAAAGVAISIGASLVANALNKH